MKLTLIAYDKGTGNHRCKDENGCIRWVDLMVSCSFDRPAYTDYQELQQFCESLIGQEVEVERLTPYVEIAHGVKLLQTA
jgi:hypothetical protein